MIVCLVAIEKNQGIGFQGFMPWPHLKEDLTWFEKRSNGHIVLMGSNTWKSIGKYLKNRINVVISSKQDLTGPDHVLSNPHEAIEFLKKTYPDKDICIVGGQKIYDSLQEYVDAFYITHINESYNCDTFFNLLFVLMYYQKITDLYSVPATKDTPSYTIKEYKK